MKHAPAQKDLTDVQYRTVKGASGGVERAPSSLSAMTASAAVGKTTATLLVDDCASSGSTTNFRAVMVALSRVQGS